MMPTSRTSKSGCQPSQKFLACLKSCFVMTCALPHCGSSPLCPAHCCHVTWTYYPYSPLSHLSTPASSCLSHLRSRQERSGYVHSRTSNKSVVPAPRGSVPPQHPATCHSSRSALSQSCHFALFVNQLRARPLTASSRYATCNLEHERVSQAACLQRRHE